VAATGRRPAGELGPTMATFITAESDRMTSTFHPTEQRAFRPSEDVAISGASTPPACAAPRPETHAIISCLLNRDL